MTAPLPTPFSLRAYQTQDLPAIVALFQASVSQLAAGHYDAAQRQAWAPETADMYAWQTRLSSLELLIAEDDQVIAGFIGFSLDGHIDLLFTAPGHARQGVATALYAAAEQRLRTAGARELFTEASLTARPFFARQGFSEEQAQTVTRGAVTLPRFAMRKILEPQWTP
jgi:putative acetyltransferase